MPDGVVEIIGQPGAVSVVSGGPPGPPGPPGSGSGVEDFEHTQSAASAEWIVNHNLGVEPAVCVLSAGGVQMDAQIVHVSLNQCRIYFASAQTGRVRCL